MRVCVLVKANPKDGVVWQTGEESPSSHLLKVTGGERQDAEERVPERDEPALTRTPQKER